MYEYKDLQKELNFIKEQKYSELIKDIKNINKIIEKVISLALNSTSAKVERNYNIKTF